MQNHFAAFCTISTTRQRFLADSGRVSTIRTRSPVVAPRSSCAMNFDVRRTYRRYFGCNTNLSTRTTTVFCILSDETVPTFCTRLPRRPLAVTDDAAAPSDAGATGAADSAGEAVSAATVSGLPASATGAVASSVSELSSAAIGGGASVGCSFFFLLNIRLLVCYG